MIFFWECTITYNIWNDISDITDIFTDDDGKLNQKTKKLTS